MLDLKEERRYNRLRKLAQELHIPMPEAFWTLEVFDKGGKLLQRHHQRSHSWTRNAYNNLFSNVAEIEGDDAAFGTGKLSYKDTGAVVVFDDTPLCMKDNQPCDDPTAVNGWIGDAGEDDKGIVVGSGTNAESFEDYVLQTLIVSGALGGQLDYAQQLAPALTNPALILTDTLIRYFNNNSGGNVSVNEVGIISKQMISYDDILMVRDKLTSTVTVPDTGQLKVTYTVELTYPS